MRKRTGSVFFRRGSWWARIRWTDPATGRVREIGRASPTKAEAIDNRDRLLREFDHHGSDSLQYERTTFIDLADWFEKTYLVAPVYVDGRKVDGLRSWRDQRGRLRILREHFGRRLIRAITHSDLRKLKTARLTTPTRSGQQRAIATVNRELNLLRRMFNVAWREGWLLKNPFTGGDSLISTADERQRERILTGEEERKLLAACDRPRYRHLIPLIICALDTGMRRGEMLKLAWADIDFEKRSVTVRAFNTKTMRQRQIAMTTRLAAELYRLAATDGTADATDLVFGITDTVKNAFRSVRRLAGLLDVRFHDLRHTAATRLVRGGLSLAEVGRILGHTQPQTTYRYVNADESTARRAADILDAVAPTSEIESTVN